MFPNIFLATQIHFSPRVSVLRRTGVNPRVLYDLRQKVKKKREMHVRSIQNQRKGFQLDLLWGTQGKGGAGKWSTWWWNLCISLDVPGAHISTHGLTQAWARKSFIIRLSSAWQAAPSALASSSSFEPGSQWLAPLSDKIVSRSRGHPAFQSPSQSPLSVFTAKTRTPSHCYTRKGNWLTANRELNYAELNEGCVI